MTIVQESLRARATTQARRATPSATARATVARTSVAKLGTPSSSGTWEYTVTDTKQEPWLGANTPPRYDPTIGGYVLVSVRATNIGAQARPLSRRDFSLLDGTGAQYEPFGGAVNNDSLRQHGHPYPHLIGFTMPYAPGTTASMTVIFDVPPGAPGLRLRLTLTGALIALQ
jgi:Domain of unknown function (DUF4352)